MRKEVIFALILGSMLGGVILYGINLANKSASLNPQPITETTSPKTPQTTPPITPDLIIATPQNHAVVFESELTIKGSSKPGSTIVIVSDEDEKIIDTDDNGSFDTTVELLGGENNILVSSYLSSTPIASASLQIIYTSNVIE